MPGPLSTPNGDTSIVRYHINEEFIFVKTDEYHPRVTEYNQEEKSFGYWLPKRTFLAERNRLITGKTQASSRRNK